MVLIIPGFVAFVVVLWAVSEFRCRRWIRLGLGVTAVVSSAGLALATGSFQRMELDEKYRAASCNLAAAVEGAIKQGQADRVASDMHAFRMMYGSYPMGPHDFHNSVQAAADRINTPQDPGR